MKTFALLVSVSLCGWIIFFTELARKEVVYDCRMATYPMAIDVPKEVVAQCRQKGIWRVK